MSLTFLNVLLWPLLGLAILPLLIHLFARARPPAVPFSSVAFIMRIVKRTQRIKRPRDWLLWLIRTAVVLLLIGFFLKPLWFAHPRLAAPHQAQTAVIVMDASASMAVMDGAQSRWATASAEASAILGGLGEGDRANIIWLRSRPDAVFPAPGPNLRFLRDQLRAAEVTHERGQPQEALRVALDMLRDEEGSKRLYIVSDFQTTNWQDVRVPTPPDVTVVTIPVGESLPDNTAIRRVHLDPPNPIAGEDISIYVDVANYSDRPVEAALDLTLGALRQRESLHMEPDEEQTIAFHVAALSAGSHPLSVQMDEDAFPADNRRFDVIRVRPALRVGVHGEALSGMIRSWTRALRATGWFTVEPWDGEWAPGQPAYDALLCAGGDTSTLAAAARYVREGGLLLWAPADGDDEAKLRAVTGNDWAWSWPQPLQAQQTTTESPFDLQVSERDDPVFTLFADGTQGDPARGTILERLLAPAPAESGLHTLLRYVDDVPALLHGRLGQGRLIWWNIPLHSGAGDWAEQLAFLPLLSELLLQYRARLPLEDARRSFEPGDTLTWRPEQDVLLADVQLERVGGDTKPIVRRETEDGPVFWSEPVAQTGIYRWSMYGTPVHDQAVNFPAVESDFRVMDPATVDAYWIPIARGHDSVALRAGLEIWKYLLIGVLLLSVCEAFVLWEGRRR